MGCPVIIEFLDYMPRAAAVARKGRNGGALAQIANLKTNILWATKKRVPENNECKVFVENGKSLVKSHSNYININITSNVARNCKENGMRMGLIKS